MILVGDDLTRKIQPICDGSADDAGRGAGTVYLDPKVAGSLLRDAARDRAGITLNPGQEAAGILPLASSDRIIAVLGVAGAGKSSMLSPAAELVGKSGSLCRPRGPEYAGADAPARDRHRVDDSRAVPEGA